MHVDKVPVGLVDKEEDKESRFEMFFTALRIRELQQLYTPLNLPVLLHYYTVE